MYKRLSQIWEQPYIDYKIFKKYSYYSFSIIDHGALWVEHTVCAYIGKPWWKASFSSENALVIDH